MSSSVTTSITSIEASASTNGPQRTSPGSIEEAPDHGSNTDMKDFREKQDFLCLSFVWDGEYEETHIEASEGGHQRTDFGAAEAEPHDG